MSTERPVFGQLSFYDAMAAALNRDEEWLADKGKPLSYTMIYGYGEPLNKTFFMAYDEGRVTEVCELESVDARPADFVVSGAAANWKAVLTKQVKPTTAMATGKLKVKGRQTILLKNMASFSYILDVMTQLDPVYPDAI